MGDEEGTECISILLSEPIAGGKLVAHFIKFPAFVLPQRSLPYSVLVANPNNSIVHLYHMPLLNFLPSLSLSPHSHWCLLKWFPKDTTPNQVFISSSVLGRTQAKPNIFTSDKYIHCEIKYRLYDSKIKLYFWSIYCMMAGGFWPSQPQCFPQLDWTLEKFLLPLSSWPPFFFFFFL